MSRTEDYLAGKLDRDAAKEKRTARTLQVRELAKATINCRVKEQPAEDQETYIRAAGDQLRVLAGQVMGEAAAVGMFGGLAWSADLKLSRDQARAKAEQELAKLRHANDDEGGPVTAGDALASALRKLARPELDAIADELEGGK